MRSSKILLIVGWISYLTITPFVLTGTVTVLALFGPLMAFVAAVLVARLGD